MNAYILAGGKGKRINFCKSFIKIKDRFLIDIIIENLSLYFDKDIYIVIKKDQQEDFKRYKNLIIEEIKISSSIIGIYTALMHTDKEWNFIIGTDMPGLNIELIKGMCTYRKDVDIIVPVVRGYPEPLFALYNRNILLYLKKQISEGEYKIQNLYKKVRTLYLKEEIIRKYDPELKSFININTWEDYRRAIPLL